MYLTAAQCPRYAKTGVGGCLKLTWHVDGDPA